MLVPKPKKIAVASGLVAFVFYIFHHVEVEGLHTMKFAPHPMVQNANGGIVKDQPIGAVPFPSTQLGGQNVNARNAWLDDATQSLQSPNSNFATQQQQQIQVQQNFAQQSERKAPAPIYTAVDQPKIRLASFHLNHLTVEKWRDPFVSDPLLQLLADFDCISLQGLSGENQELLPMIVRSLNSTNQSSQYDFVVGPVIRAQGQVENLAFVFKVNKLEVDRNQTYTLNDPNNVLEIEPLVAWFRVRSDDESAAMTFTFVNAILGRGSNGLETDYLPDLLSSVQGDGRNEDDVILGGYFSVDENLRNLVRSSNWKLLPDAADAVETSSDQLGAAGQSHMLLTSFSQAEYIGNSGKINVLRRYNLRPEQVDAISSDSPIWAEFYAAESMPAM